MKDTYTFTETLDRNGNYVAIHNPKLRHVTTDRGVSLLFGKNQVSFISKERIGSTYVEENDGAE